MIDGIHIRVEGLALEKLMNRALEDGISFLSVQKTGARAMEIWLRAADAKRFLALTERFSYRTRILERRGKNAVLCFLKMRWGIFLALALAGSMLWAFSVRIWRIDIEVEGSRYAPVSVLEDALFDLGIKPGMLRSDIDANALEMALYEKTGCFSFIGVQVQGVRLRIGAAGEIEPPELFDLEADRDLVAMRDGIVLSVHALAGTACVEAGDTVRAGQVLISGEERISAELTGGVCALGEVVAKTWHEGRAEASLTETKKIYTGQKSSRSVLGFFDFAWSLDEGETYARMDERMLVFPIVGMFLPVQIVRWDRAEYRSEVQMRSIEAAKSEAEKIAYENALSGLPEGCVIVDKWTDYSIIMEDRIQARVVIEAESNIAGTRQALNAMMSFAQ